jgi:Domain of unknown function (DUF4157)
MLFHHANLPYRNLGRLHSKIPLIRPSIQENAPINFALNPNSGLQIDLSQIPLYSSPLQAKSKLSGSAGKSIPTPLRTKMEQSFNTSFANVTLHEGTQASSIGALAYTQGNQIHFASGKFHPDTASGQALLGHELAHVVQQRQGRVKPTGQVKGLPLNDNLALEQEADRLGLKAAQA